MIWTDANRYKGESCKGEEGRNGEYKILKVKNMDVKSVRIMVDNKAWNKKQCKQSPESFDEIWGW